MSKDITFPWTASLTSNGWAEIRDANDCRIADMSDFIEGKTQADLIVHAINSLPALVDWCKDIEKSKKEIALLEAKIAQLEQENAQLRAKIDLISDYVH